MAHVNANGATLASCLPWQGISGRWGGINVARVGHLGSGVRSWFLHDFPHVMFSVGSTYTTYKRWKYESLPQPEPLESRSWSDVVRGQDIKKHGLN